MKYSAVAFLVLFIYYFFRSHLIVNLIFDHLYYSARPSEARLPHTHLLGSFKLMIKEE